MDKAVERNVYFCVALAFMMMFLISTTSIAINVFNFVAGFHAYDMAFNALLLSYNEGLDIYDRYEDCTLGTECIKVSEEYRYGNILLMDSFVNIVGLAFVAGVSFMGSMGYTALLVEEDGRTGKHK